MSLSEFIVPALREYNTIRPHSSLGYKPPAPEAVMSNTGHAHMAGVLTLRVVQ
jgi:hypothetical protein